jgi:Ca2+/H+ antiporter
MPRIVDAISDVAFVLNEWIDRRVGRRNISDAFAVGVLLSCSVLNCWAAIIVVYGMREFDRISDTLRPFLVPTLVAIMIVGDWLFLRLYRHAKMRIAELTQEESRRCQSRAWKVLWSYFVLTIASIAVLVVATMIARHKGPT